MEADAHARRSPAVRARHFGKRVPVAGQKGDSFPADIFSDDPFFTITDDGSADQFTDTAFQPLATSDPNATSDPDATTDPSLESTATDLPSTSADTPLSTSSSIVSTSSTPTISSPTAASTTSSAVPVTATPSTTDAASNAAPASSSSKGITGGGIAAIVTIFVVAFLAVALFFVRKRYIRNRQLKRGTWGAGAFAKHAEFVPEQGEKTYDNGSGFMPGVGNTSSFTSSAFGQQQQGGFGQQSPIAPPPMSYNNLTPSSAVPPSLSPGMGAAVGMERASASPTPMDALIKCTFVPSLPDELSITTGETVRVVAEYDDGWAMCANARGEQGMVPLECLDQTKGRGSVGDINFQGLGAWRGSKRVSSLPPARY